MKPLEGIKIVELAEYVAVPGAPRLMSEWGATVWKVERPVGDPCRYLGPSFKMIDFTKSEDDFNHVVDYMVGGNRKYVCLDLKKPEGMEALHKLLENADVFATSWRQKALDKMGLDYETLKKKYPGLVYAQVTGYGEVGSEKDNPGYDTIAYAARGGWFRTLPQEGDAPMNWPNALGDLPASVALCAGICAALVKKARTGKGDRVLVSLYNAAMYFLMTGIVTSTYDNHYPSSRKNPPSPLNNTYPCKDGGWIYICMPVYDAEWRKCVTFLGRPELADDPKFNNYSRVREENRVTEVVELLEDLFKQKDSDEWARLFKEHDIPAGKCFEIDDILKDDFAWENNFLRKINYEKAGEKIVVDSPVRFAEMGLPELVTSKPIGYHSEEVLKSVGYSQEEYDKLVESGTVVVKQHHYD